MEAKTQDGSPASETDSDEMQGTTVSTMVV